MRTWVLALIVVAGVWLAAIGLLALVGRPRQAREIAAFIPNLAMLFRGLIRDPAVPRHVKVLLVIAVAWIASPIDPVPEFIPVIGTLDDALVAVLAIRISLRHVDSSVLASHWRGDPSTLNALLRAAGRRLEP
ncbi:MAG: DUF1232 domain-containing protein [Actinomycetota bacterium]